VAVTFCQNIYLELSSLSSHLVLEVLSQVPPSRLMIGSDLPENLEDELGKIVHLDADSRTRADILWHTAWNVLHAPRIAAAVRTEPV